MDDEGLADEKAASPFRLPRLHPGNGFGVDAGPTPGAPWASIRGMTYRYAR